MIFSDNLCKYLDLQTGCVEEIVRAQKITDINNRRQKVRKRIPTDQTFRIDSFLICIKMFYFYMSKTKKEKPLES